MGGFGVLLARRCGFTFIKPLVIHPHELFHVAAPKRPRQILS